MFCGVVVYCAAAYIPPMVSFKLGAYGVRVNGRLRDSLSLLFHFVFNAILDTCFCFRKFQPQYPQSLALPSLFPLHLARAPLILLFHHPQKRRQFNRAYKDIHIRFCFTFIFIYFYSRFSYGYDEKTRDWRF